MGYSSCPLAVELPAPLPLGATSRPTVSVDAAADSDDDRAVGGEAVAGFGNKVGAVDDDVHLGASDHHQKDPPSSSRGWPFGPI